MKINKLDITAISKGLEPHIITGLRKAITLPDEALHIGDMLHSLEIPTMITDSLQKQLIESNLIKASERKERTVPPLLKRFRLMCIHTPASPPEHYYACHCQVPCMSEMLKKGMLLLGQSSS